MTILHFCPRGEWTTAKAAGRYTADSLFREGYIHCSTAAAVHLPATALARGRTDLVLLEIDEHRLEWPLRWERADGEVFPHVYGPIGVDAVVAVHEFQPGPDGAFAPVDPGRFRAAPERGDAGAVSSGESADPVPPAGASYDLDVDDE
jgi:uncharacterized protein (DUF952 family)